LAEKGIKGAAFGPQTVRLVTHLDFTEAMLDQALEVISALR
jgi:threonine aldolase